MSHLNRFRELEEQGVDILAILAGDSGVDDHKMELLLESLGPLGDEYHRDLMELLTEQIFDPSEARGLWKGIVRHKRKMESALGRPVGVRVAAADYLTNRRPVLDSPRIVAREQMQRLNSQVRLDPLTELLNRRSIDASLRREMQRSRRYNTIFTVMLIDADHFKAVNDQQGHVAGDAVLVEIARRLSSACRETDTVGRWGGDEMLIILPETTPVDALILSERLRRDISRKPILLHNGEVWDTTISIGIAAYPEHGTVAQELVDAASTALRGAKSDGRDIEAIAGSSGAAPRSSRDATSREVFRDDSPPTDNGRSRI